MPCGGPQKSPRTSSIVRLYFYLLSFGISEYIWSISNIFYVKNNIFNSILTIVMYDSYLLKDVHSVLVNFPREYAQESMILYI